MDYPLSSPPLRFKAKNILGLIKLVICYVLLNCIFIPPLHAECVLIDTDYDIDDMMAIPLVIGNMHVSGIVTTEGYTQPAAAAATLTRFLADSTQRKIPVIAGAATNVDPLVIKQKWPWMPYIREQMHQSNGLFPVTNVIKPSNHSLVDNVISSLANCSKVSILILGPFSSFVQYSSAIKPKIDQVIISGKPLISLNQKRPFNCEYDLNACVQAMTQLKTVKSIFVDIPRNNTISYEPDLAMMDGLQAAGLPGTLKQALNHNHATWLPTALSKENGGPGGKSLLWDQSTALYLLHPNLFAAPLPGANHVEPILVNGNHAQTLELLRKLWTEDSNQAIEYK